MQVNIISLTGSLVLSGLKGWIMELLKVETTEDYQVMRFVSENNIWQAGIPYASNVGSIRVAISRNPFPVYQINYDAGLDKGMALGILAQVLYILQELPEDITVDKLLEIFPQQEDNEAGCLWEELFKISFRLSLFQNTDDEPQPGYHQPDSA
jgi:hypothetical protein